MGNHRFKLSDMMPNAWFYKLRDMSKVRSHNPAKTSMQSSSTSSRKSFYYTAESIRTPKFSVPHEPPIFTKKRAKRKTVYMPFPRTIAPSDPSWLKPGNIREDSTSPYNESSLSGFEYDDQSRVSSCSCTSDSDIILDVDETAYNALHIHNLTECNMVSEPNLPPIQTKPGKPHAASLEHSVVFHNTSIKFPLEKPKRTRRTSTSPGSRKSFSGGVKIRGNGRKLGGKKAEGRRRKDVEEEQGKKKKKGMFYSDSFAIVKASFDPEKDFKESMMEMIVENNIREAKDLEELLASYLSLNSNQYHDLIIKAFEEVWFKII